MFEIYQNFPLNNVFKYCKHCLKVIYFKTDILHDCTNTTQSLIHSSLQNNWFNEEKFEEICTILCGCSLKEFFGKNFRYFTLNFERWESAISISLYEDNYKLLKGILSTWRVIYIIVYQPESISSKKEFQIYFIIAVFQLYTLFIELPDSFYIIITYQHACFILLT